MTEAICKAQEIHGAKALTGEQVRDGLENLVIDEARLEELGLAGFMPAIAISCADHQGTHPIVIQQWDGKAWSLVSDWIMPMRDVVRPMIEASAAQYAAEKGITPRSCDS